MVPGGEFPVPCAAASVMTMMPPPECFHVSWITHSSVFFVNNCLLKNMLNRIAKYMIYNKLSCEAGSDSMKLLILSKENLP